MENQPNVFETDTYYHTQLMKKTVVLSGYQDGWSGKSFYSCSLTILPKNILGANVFKMISNPKWNPPDLSCMFTFPQKSPVNWGITVLSNLITLL